MAEDGDPGRAGAPMALMRLADGPIIQGQSPEFRALHPEAKGGPVLLLPAGWEPFWTEHEVVTSANPPAELAAHPQPSAPQGPATEDGYGPTCPRTSDRGWLVFSARTDAGDWDLFVARPDGWSRHPHRHSPVQRSRRSLSPDGTRLLYYRIPRSEPVDNNTYGTFDLVIANADGSDPQTYGTEFPWALLGNPMAAKSPASAQRPSASWTWPHARRSATSTAGHRAAIGLVPRTASASWAPPTGLGSSGISVSSRPPAAKSAP